MFRMFQLIPFNRAPDTSSPVKNHRSASLSAIPKVVAIITAPIRFLLPWQEGILNNECVGRNNPSLGKAKTAETESKLVRPTEDRG